MASPQKENGYVPIANETVEQLAKIRISGECMQLLWVVFRKTYGFNKRSDSIAFSQFVMGTGMKKQNVNRGLKKLVEMGLLVVSNNDYKGNTYEFIKDYEYWKPSAKKMTVSNIDSGVSNIVYNRKQKRLIQKTKDTNTKDTRKSQSDSGLIVEVIDSFKEVNPSFRDWYRNTTQRKAIDSLIIDHGVDTVKRVVGLLPKTNNMAYFPTITSPTDLRRDWAKLKSKLEQEKDKHSSKETNVAFI